MKTKLHALTLLLIVSRAAIVLLLPIWLFVDGPYVVWGDGWVGLGVAVRLCRVCICVCAYARMYVYMSVSKAS
jgi:hypothetical protein